MSQPLDAFLNGPAHYAAGHHFSSGLALSFALIAVCGELIILYGIVRGIMVLSPYIQPLLGLILRRYGTGDQEQVSTFLELTFPSGMSPSASATAELHGLLRSITKYRSTIDRMAAHKKPYSLEIVASHNEGIRSILKVPTWAAGTVQQTLQAFMSGLQIRVVDDYLATVPDGPRAVVELRLSADYVLPLHTRSDWTEYDPMAFLTGRMTKLAAHEMVAYQVVIVPVLPHTHHRVMRHVTDIRRRLAAGKEVASQVAVQRSTKEHAMRLAWFPLIWVLAAYWKAAKFVGGLLISVVSKNRIMAVFRHADRGDGLANNLADIAYGLQLTSKLDQPLYEITIRLLVLAQTPERVQSRLEALVDSFQQFQGSSQALIVRQPDAWLFQENDGLRLFAGRLLSPHLIDQQTIVSSAELANLYHFPQTDLTKTEGIVTHRSAELPAPLSIKHTDTTLDVVVGVNRHGGEEQLIGMTIEQRQKHTYVIGKTGTGKTTLLKSAIYQDMVNGKGLAVLDPHGDMFHELLSLVPKERLRDIVIFDPSDRAFPLGLNVLDPGIVFADEDDKYDLITSSVISVFKKLADPNQWGARMEHVLRNAIMTALQLPKPSLYTLQQLLTDKNYQKKAAASLRDPVLKQFWDKEFKLLGTMQMSSMTAPLTNRLGKFMTSKRSRHILLQEKTTLNIADIMNEGKILLVNLSKGQIGEDQSSFFGTILTSMMWMAAYQRTDIPEKQRRDFFLYVDEFQNFASPDFSEIVSEGRKYHISLVVSHQNVAQISDTALLDSIVSNASTIICLKVGPNDEAFMLPYMQPEVARGAMINLPPYHFYMKTTHSISEDAFSGMTVPLTEESNGVNQEAVLSASRQRYGTPRRVVEAYMEVLFFEPGKLDGRGDAEDGKRAQRVIDGG